MSLALHLLVGSLSVVLQAGCTSRFCFFSMYSFLSKTTIATPLSAVKTILSLSLFNSNSEQSQPHMGQSPT